MHLQRLLMFLMGKSYAPSSHTSCPPQVPQVPPDTPRLPQLTPVPVPLPRHSSLLHRQLLRLLTWRPFAQVAFAVAVAVVPLSLIM